MNLQISRSFFTVRNSRISLFCKFNLIKQESFTKMNLDGLDDFLDEVDLVHKKIKELEAGNISVDEIDKLEKEKNLEKQKKETLKKIKEEEKAQEVIKGRPGKGEGDDYKNFCMGCFTEYTLETPKCVKCNRDTITKEQRHADLKGKLEEYKKKKASKEERKAKWENWRKTQAIYWKKTSTNYSKWDYFTSSSEDEPEQEPILPRNDPNFLALEKDVEERAKRRKRDHEMAHKMKLEGNEFMKNRDFLKAIDCYTVGLEKARDMKELYTNRALAYIKLGNYEKAIEDCDKVLEYIEIFEKGYDKSAELSFKALIRRAQSNRELNKIDQAFDDIEQALKLNPNDKEGLRLKAEFELFKQQKIKAAELMKPESEEPKSKESGATDVKADFSTIDKCRDVIDKYLDEKQPSKQRTELVVKLFKQNPEFKIYANEKGMWKKVCNLLLTDNFDKMIYLLIITFFQDNPIYLEEFFKHFGPTNLYKRIDKDIDQLKRGDQNKQIIFQDIEELCETFLNITEQEKGRIMLKDQPYLVSILTSLYEPTMSNVSEEKEAATSFFSLVANLIIVSEKFAKFLDEKYLNKLLEDSVAKIFCKTKTSKYNRLKENLYGVFANLIRDDTIRVKFLNIDDKLEKLYAYILESLDGFAIMDKSRIKWIRSVESILAIFINLSFGVTHEVREKIFVKKLNLYGHISRFFALDYRNENYFNVIYRATQLASKINFPGENIKEIAPHVIKMFTDHFDERAKSRGLSNHTIRLFLKWLSKENEEIIKKYFTIDDIAKLVGSIVQVLKETDEERFVNSTMLAGSITDIYPPMGPRFKDCIPILLEICKNKTGLWRKNAGILVAKLAKNPENLQVFRENHGIEILSSVSSFILDKQ